MGVRCKHCRENLLNNQPMQLLTAHSKIKINLMDAICGVNDPETCSYISVEKMPKWIEDVINQESWTKGRLQCPNCNNRIGSFNFVTELKCKCNQFILPPIKITNSKVDIVFDSK